MSKALLVLALLCTCHLATAGSAKEVAASSHFVLRDFRMRGVTDDKRMDWTVHGGMAEVDGALVRLRGVALTFKPLTGTGDPVVVTSPRCEFNREDKTGNSDAPLHVHSRQVDVEGVGYDILTAQQQLHIRSQVHMKIRPDRDVGAVVPGLLHRPGTAAPAGTTKTEGTKAR